LSPVMPTQTAKVLEILGASGSLPKWGELKVGSKLKDHDALFPRLESIKS